LKYEYGGVKGGWEFIYELQGGVCKEFVRRPKNPAKGAAEWELCSECRKGNKIRNSTFQWNTIKCCYEWQTGT